MANHLVVTAYDIILFKSIHEIQLHAQYAAACHCRPDLWRTGTLYLAKSQDGGRTAHLHSDVGPVPMGNMLYFSAGRAGRDDQGFLVEYHVRLGHCHTPGLADLCA